MFSKSQICQFKALGPYTRSQKRVAAYKFYLCNFVSQYYRNAVLPQLYRNSTEILTQAATPLKLFIHLQIVISILPHLAVNCGPIAAPMNGEKIIETSTFLNGEVKFQCIGQRFKLVGDSTRKCLGSGQWSGTQPICQCKF